MWSVETTYVKYQSSWTCAIFGWVIIKIFIFKTLTCFLFLHANALVHDKFWLGKLYNFLDLGTIPISLQSLPNTLVGLHLGILRYISTHMGRPRVVVKGCEYGTLWAHLDVLVTNSLHHTQELCLNHSIWQDHLGTDIHQHQFQCFHVKLSE